MLRELIEWLLPHLQTVAVDPDHPHSRRYTDKYRRKQDLVKSLWIGSGLVMISFPALPFIVGTSLFTTFMAFVILDETQ